jgi:hypothetical protein
MRLALLIAAFLAAAPVAAQTTDWGSARQFDLLALPDEFQPNPIRLEAGQPVKLRFFNLGQSASSFSAEDFFEAARFRPGDSELVVDGRVQVPAGEQVEVALVPAAGRYHARSGNPLRRRVGARIDIIVE